MARRAAKKALRMRTFITTNGYPIMGIHRTKLSGQHRGFTLVELLLVIIVMTVALGLGGGVYVGTYKAMLIKKAARDVFVMAQYARIAAIENQTRVNMIFDKMNRRIVLTMLVFDPESQESENTEIRNPFCRPVTFASQVDLEGVVISDNQIDESGSDDAQEVLTFYPNGTADMAAIQVGDGKTHYSIGVSSSTGKARLVCGEATELSNMTVDLDSDENE